MARPPAETTSHAPIGTVTGTAAPARTRARPQFGLSCDEQSTNTGRTPAFAPQAMTNAPTNSSTYYG